MWPVLETGERGEAIVHVINQQAVIIVVVAALQRRIVLIARCTVKLLHPDARPAEPGASNWNLTSCLSQGLSGILRGDQDFGASSQFRLEKSRLRLGILLVASSEPRFGI